LITLCEVLALKWSLCGAVGTNLQALLDYTARSELSSSIVLVISNVAGVKGLERAAKAGVDTAVCHLVLMAFSEAASAIFYIVGSLEMQGV